MDTSNRKEAEREQYRPYWREACVDYYSPLLRLACRRANGRIDVAEDIVQEMVYRVLAYPKNPVEVRNPLGYLQRIMRNVRIARWMKEKLAVTESLEEMMSDPSRQNEHPAVEPVAERTIETKERMEDFRNKIGPLTKDEKFLLESFLNSQTFEEIADALGEDVCRTKARWYALLAKLRYRLRGGGGKSKR